MRGIKKIPNSFFSDICAMTLKLTTVIIATIIIATMFLLLFQRVPIMGIFLTLAITISLIISIIFNTIKYWDVFKMNKTPRQSVRKGEKISNF